MFRENDEVLETTNSFKRRGTRAEEAKETGGSSEKRVASIASHISFRLKERMPIRLERNKVGWKSDHAKGKSEEGKGVGSRFIFLKRRNGREIKGKIVRKIVNYRNKEIVKMHSSAKEELYFSFLFDLS